MAEGLIGNLLSTVQGLQEMDRQKRLDQQAAAQQAVDNAMREQELEMRKQALKQQTAAMEATQARFGQREQRLGAQGTERLKQGQERIDLGGRRLTQDQISRANDAANRAFSDALYRGGYSPEEATAIRDWTRENTLSQFGTTEPPNQTPGTAAGAGPVAGFGPQPQTIKPTGFGGQPATGPITLGGAAPVQQGPAMPPALTSKDMPPLIRARVANTEKRTERIAQEITQAATMADLVQQTKQAQLAREESQTKINAIRYQQIADSIGLNREKFNFDKMIQNGRLDLAKMNYQLAVLNSQRAENRDIRSGNLEREKLEKLLYQYKSDQQDTFLKTRSALDKAQATRDGAVSLVSNLRLKLMEGAPGAPRDPKTEQALFEAEQTLHQYSSDYIKKLQRDLTDAERARNEADRSWRAARDLYSTPMTGQGTPMKTPKGLPGLPGLGMLGGTPAQAPRGLAAPTGKTLDRATAAQILQEAGGDRNKAREIARKRGYRF